MCGIVGYVGDKSAKHEILEMLKLLEYRGYDSAGIACLHKNKIENTKATGNISVLEKILQKDVKVSCGIGHTRWATHGKPNVKNAHPHLSQNKKWAVVHNGIIENYMEIKTYLKKEQGMKFISQTDSEVIAQLIQNQKQKGIEKIINVCKKLNGSYAIAVICSEEKNTIYLAKKKSPLYVALGLKEKFIASDPICFASKTDSYFSLNDDEFCVVKQHSIKFFDINGTEIKKEKIKLNFIDKEVDKMGYSHYMLKEINETPKVLNDIVENYKRNGFFLQITKRLLSKINKFILIGCGTAYHASLFGENVIEKFLRKEARAYVASEFIYKEPILDNKTLCIFVSQSGETADTIKAVEYAKEKGCKTVAITNVTYSTLAKCVDFVLPVFAGKEIAVASTKTYTGQLAILYMLAKHMENIMYNKNNEYYSNILEIADKVLFSDTRILDKLTKNLIEKKEVFLLGKGLDYITAEEASLKLKETTYINSTAYPSGELKHGFLALIERGTIVFVLATQKELLTKSLNSAFEVSARGGEIVVVTNQRIKQYSKEINDVVYLPDFDDEVMPIVATCFFQILSYSVSVKKGINPDQPRNLAKSVTVE